MNKNTKHTVQMSKRGAYLHLTRSGKRAQVIPNKKRQANRNFCRSK